MKNQDESLNTFRTIAAAMLGPTDWQWIGRWESQRHFGISEERAKELEARHGGEAKKMDEARDFIATHTGVHTHPRS